MFFKSNSKTFLLLTRTIWDLQLHNLLLCASALCRKRGRQRNWNKTWFYVFLNKTKSQPYEANECLSQKERRPFSLSLIDFYMEVDAKLQNASTPPREFVKIAFKNICIVGIKPWWTINYFALRLHVSEIQKIVRLFLHYLWNRLFWSIFTSAWLNPLGLHFSCRSDTVFSLVSQPMKFLQQLWAEHQH